MSELTDRGNLLFSQHRFELAADVFRRALQEAPNDAYAHARLALCFAALEKTKDAYTEAHSAIAASPNYAYAHYALALVYDSDGRRAESENAVLVAIHHDPWKSYYFALLARARLLQNKWTEALEAAEQGLSIDANDKICASHRSNALMHLGKTDDAVSAAKDTLGQNPDSSSSHSTLGWALLYAHDYVGAERHFREALRLEPGNDWARNGMMRALKEKNLVYRSIQRYFRWRRSLGGITRVVFVALLVATRFILSAVSDHCPALRPICLLGIALYWIFFLSIWAATPIGNFVLMLDPYGRYLLSRGQMFMARCTGVVLAILCVCAVVGTLRYKPGWIVIGLFSLLIGYLISKVASESNIVGRGAYGTLAVLAILLCGALAVAIGL